MRRQSPGPRFAIGDVHGHVDELAWLLSSAGLTDGGLRWTGADATLWFIGDYVDRGPDGIAVIEAVARLQTEAAQAGGFVGAILGNHDVFLASAAVLGDVRFGRSETFRRCWERNGGRFADLARLGPEHLDWIRGLPAMAVDGDVLLVHADSPAYADLGASVEAVNRTARDVLSGKDPREWALLVECLSLRGAFSDDVASADAFLDAYGGRTIVHGHTPIWLATGLPPNRITRPLVYAGGRCVNVDGGLYSGGPGFLYELPA